MTDDGIVSERSSRFPTTRWSLVLQAAEGETQRAREALAYLCEAYWFPLYAFARRGAADSEDAKDLVQGFFADFLGRTHLLRHVSSDEGRFRSYLLTAYKHYKSRVDSAAGTVKRGGGIEHVPIDVDFDDGERRYRAELVTNEDPETLYERQWALTFLDRVLKRLRARYVELGDEAIHDRLVPYLPKGDVAPPYGQISEALGMTVGALKVAHHRLRLRHQKLLYEEARDVFSEPERAREEIRHLLSVLVR